MYSYDYGYYGYRSPVNEDLVVFLKIAIIAVLFLTFVARCRMFTKAGMPWERLFVPIYGGYATYSICDCGGLFWLRIVLYVLGIFITGMTGEPAIMIMAMLAILVIHCVYCVKLAKAFGKSGGFGVGLILLFPIFIMILGFGSAAYELGGGLQKHGLEMAGWTCKCGTHNPASRGACENCGQLKP